MKSFTMKALAVAVLGLAGMSAHAVCSNPTPFAAWSSWNGTTNTGASFGGVTVAGNGLNGTSCSMNSSFANKPGSNAQQAVVFDNTPALEQAYRFRFYVDPTNIASSLSTTNTVSAFVAKSLVAHPASGGTQSIAQLVLVGNGTNVALRVFAGCASGDNKNGPLCRTTNDIVLGPKTGFPAGGVRIEGQIVAGGAGTGKVNIWVGTNVNTAAPDAVINVDNSAFFVTGTEGVKQAVMGLFQGSIPYRNATQNLTVGFDEFDSRRQTFIGL